jgi:6-phosphogluconolactonase
VQKNENIYGVIQNISTVPEGFSGNNYCADIELHPNGKFLYGSNRGHDSIVAYKIAEDGRLTLIDYYTSGGQFPRNFAISTDGNQLIVANQNSDNLLIYNIDQATGSLTLLSEIKNVMTPVCVVI